MEMLFFLGGFVHLLTEQVLVFSFYSDSRLLTNIHYALTFYTECFLLYTWHAMLPHRMCDLPQWQEVAIVGIKHF